MWYQFNENGECISSCTAKVAPIDGVVSVNVQEEYPDIKNVRLINGEVYHLEPEEGENDGTNLSS